MLDAYGVGEEAPVLVFLHLICPTLKHHEYSKTEIDRLPFKEALGHLFDEVLTHLQRQQEEEALHLDAAIREILATILGEVRTGERFILGQLLARVEQRLQAYPQIRTWLRRADAAARIQHVVVQYVNENATLSQSIAQPALETLTVPLHPDRHFQLALTHLSQSLLEQHAVNKILYIQERELEAVAIENNWLCHMDLALLHQPQDPSRLREVVLHCLSRCQVPLLIWYNANQRTRTLLEEMRGWLAEHHLDTNRVVDLGQRSAAGQGNPLLMLMPAEQARWLRQQLHAQAVLLKTVPGTQQICHDLSTRIEHMVLGYVLEQVKGDLTNLFGDLDQRLGLTEMLMAQQVEQEVNERFMQEGCPESYEMVIEQVAHKQVAALMQKKRALFEQMVSQIHLREREKMGREGDKDMSSYDQEKIDEIVLALMQLTLHDSFRAWKGFDWEVLNRLYEKGWIENPRNKAKSVVLTDEGMAQSERLFEKHFGTTKTTEDQ